LSQLRPRIRPLDSRQLTCFYLIAVTCPSELFMPLFRGCEHTERIYLLREQADQGEDLNPPPPPPPVAVRSPPFRE
jgi:hypothetical protein